MARCRCVARDSRPRERGPLRIWRNATHPFIRPSPNPSPTSLARQALQWDATRLPLRPACVDAAIVDLPFGQRCLSIKKLQVLYPRALAQLARALRAGGRAVLLTLEAGELERALASQRPLWTTLEAHARVHIGCFAGCVVLVLKRTDASFDEWKASASSLYGTQPLSKQHRAAMARTMDAEFAAAPAAPADGTPLPVT